jgi:hypothetical protein
MSLFCFNKNGVFLSIFELFSFSVLITSIFRERFAGGVLLQVVEFS